MAAGSTPSGPEDSSAGETSPDAHAADRELAARCSRGDDAAWRTLHEDWLPRVRAFLVRRGARADEADGVVGGLPGHLAQPPADGAATTRIATYRGRSALFTWLAVVAWRLLERQRRDARATQHPLPAADDLPAAKGASPLDQVIGAEQARRFASALHEAFDALTPRERLVVLFAHRDGLAQRTIAELLDIGEPRVSRLLGAGLDRLHREVARRLYERPAEHDASDAVAWDALRRVASREMATRASEEV